MVVGPYPRSLTRIDGGVAAATTYLSQAMARVRGIEIIGIRIGGRAVTGLPAESLGWQVVNVELGRFSASTMFRRQQRQFSEILGRFRPHIVHAQGADVAGFLAVRSGYPSIVTIHGILTECARFRTSPVRRVRELLQARITEQFVVERAKHIVAISPYIATYYRNRLHATLFDIPNAVAHPFFELNREPERGRFLFAGRISKGKGVMDLVRAVAQCPQAVERAVLAGASPEPDFDRQLRSAIAKSGRADRFELTGLLDEQAMLAEFARATALVLPSYQETAPMVIQQAMAAGLPVIATRVGGIPDLIEHETTGLLFDPGDIDALGSLLLRVREDRTLCLRLASAARRKAVETFTADRVAHATVEAYRRVLAVS